MKEKRRTKTEYLFTPTHSGRRKGALSLPRNINS
jgi:hypothetical protein